MTRRVICCRTGELHALPQELIAAGITKADHEAMEAVAATRSGSDNFVGLMFCIATLQCCVSSMEQTMLQHYIWSIWIIPASIMFLLGVIFWASARARTRLSKRLPIFTQKLEAFNQSVRHRGFQLCFHSVGVYYVELSEAFSPTRYSSAIQIWETDAETNSRKLRDSFSFRNEAICGHENVKSSIDFINKSMLPFNPGQVLLQVVTVPMIIPAVWVLCALMAMTLGLTHVANLLLFWPTVASVMIAYFILFFAMCNILRRKYEDHVLDVVQAVEQLPNNSQFVIRVKLDWPFKCAGYFLPQVPPKIIVELVKLHDAVETSW